MATAITKVKDWYTDKSRWTQKAYYRDESGNDYLDVPGYTKLKCCCLLGAIRMCYPDLKEQRIIRNKVYEYINIHRQYNLSVVDWNDSDYTTFRDVKKLVNELDI